MRAPKVVSFVIKGREGKCPRDWGILEPQNCTHSSRKMKYSLRVTNTSTSCRMLGCFTLVAVGGVGSQGWVNPREALVPKVVVLPEPPARYALPCHLSPLSPHTHILRMPISFLAAFRTLRPSRFWNFLQVCSLPVVLSLARKISQNSSLKPAGTPLSLGLGTGAPHSRFPNSGLSTRHCPTCPTLTS